MINKLSKFFEEEINPFLAEHNGSAEVSGFEKGVVFIKLHGACKGCPGKQQTIRNGIKPLLQANFSEVVDVLVTEL